MTDLRTRIAKVLRSALLEIDYSSAEKSADGEQWVFIDGTVMPDDLADAVIRELGAIPDREFTDQWGHHWEWCGGVTGTWAWRITKLEKP